MGVSLHGLTLRDCKSRVRDELIIFRGLGFPIFSNERYFTDLQAFSEFIMTLHPPPSAMIP